jgi:hypothetical protein
MPDFAPASRLYGYFWIPDLEDSSGMTAGGSFRVHGIGNVTKTGQRIKVSAD